MGPQGACRSSAAPSRTLLVELPTRHELVHFMLCHTSTSLNRVLLLAELLIPSGATRAYVLCSGDLILPLNDLIERARILSLMDVLASHRVQSLRQRTVLLVVGTCTTFDLLLSTVLGENKLARAGHFRVIVPNTGFGLADD